MCQNTTKNGGIVNLGPNAHGNVVEERLCDLLAEWSHLTLFEVRADQTNSAIDIKADAALKSKIEQ
jgi:hypothetical protein